MPAKLLFDLILIKSPNVVIQWDWSSTRLFLRAAAAFFHSFFVCQVNWINHNLHCVVVGMETNVKVEPLAHLKLWRSYQHNRSIYVVCVSSLYSLWYGNYVDAYTVFELFKKSKNKHA